MKLGDKLFICAAEKAERDAILAGLQSERRLTVNETGGCLQRGGVINSKRLSIGKRIAPCSKGGV